MAIVRVVGLAMERPYGPGKYNSESTDPSRRISLVELPAGFPKITLEVEGDERLIEEMDASEGGRDQMRRRTREGSTERGQVTAPFLVRGHAVSGSAARLPEGHESPPAAGITEPRSVSHVAREVHVSTFTRASNDYFALLRYCLVIGSGRGHHVGSTKRRDPIGCRPLVAVTGKHFYCTDEMTCTLEDSLQTMQSTFADMVI
ncbi:hypothetical protein GW17_00010127 [Ensete ventricosum]|nr:hypothetical protein GW17_00010127 [Ensete ventricosum]